MTTSSTLRRATVGAVAALTLTALALPAATAQAAVAPAPARSTTAAKPVASTTRTLTKLGAVTARDAAKVSARRGKASAGVAPGTAGDRERGYRNEPEREIPRDEAEPERPLPASAPTVQGSPTVTARNARGFDGLNINDQVKAAGFALEPPDQALCVHGNRVLEAVNVVLRVDDTNGQRLTDPIYLNDFFGLPADDFTSDPKCIFDQETQRWFLTLLQVDAPFPSAVAPAHTLIAVSTTSDPLGEWNRYSIDATNAGTDAGPGHTGCPCIGDQPLIGSDLFGFYITTNEFPQAEEGFNGAQVYAINKYALAKGTARTYEYVNAGLLSTPDEGGIWYSIQPAFTPPFALQELRGRGTEYFLSALQFGPGETDNRIAAWAMTNTSSLLSSSPRLQLQVQVIDSEDYAFPGPMLQKDGPRPLGESLNEPLEKLESNDDRMQQVMFAGGRLWSGLNTAVKDPGGDTHVGIAWFAVKPNIVRGDELQAKVVQQGYVARKGGDVAFPAVGVDALGRAVVGFTVAGADIYPSTGFARIRGNRTGPVEVTGVGAKPEDGFSGYRAYGGNGVARWGDYGAASVNYDGSIWTAHEYIPDIPRETLFANWGTFISRITP